MITTENLEKLLAKSITINKISAQELKSFGFNYNDIHALMEQNKLKRLKRGVYSWISSSELYNRGKELIENKKYEEARACFATCYEINPEDIDVQFQMFYKAVYEADYEKAMKYYSFLVEHLTERNDLLDLNACIILMSIHGELSMQSKEKIANFSYADLIEKPIIYPAIDLDDQVLFIRDKYRKHIILQKYDSAYTILSSLERLHSLSPYQQLIKILLNRVLIFRNKTTLELAQNKEYEKLIVHLETLINRNPLDKEMQCALILVKQILEFEKMEELPHPTISSTEDIYVAIANKEYHKALALYQECKEKGKRLPNQAIYTLLENIIELIDRRNIGEPTEENIVKLFQSQDFDAVLKLVPIYLEKQEKSEYEFLVNELVMVAQMQVSSECVPFETILSEIENNNISISIYVLACYEALARKNYKIADCYIKILLGLRTLGFSYSLLDQLVEMKNQLQHGIVREENANVLVKNSNEERVASVSSQSTIENLGKTNRTKNNQSSDTMVNADKIMLTSKYEQITKRGGIILLKTMPRARRKNIYRLIRENFPGMRGFGIGAGPEMKRLLLKEQADMDSSINMSALIKEGNKAYAVFDFETCIEKYQKVLKYNGGSIKGFVFAKLGLAYMQIRRAKTAILYLTVANELFKKEGVDRDFTELIERLQGKKIDEEDKKYYVPFAIEEFRNSVNEYYGLEAIEEIAAFVSSGKSIEEVQIQFNLTEEQVTLLMLIFARNCYAARNFTLGDQYLRRAEKRKNKTEQIKQLLDEIRRKKRFYQNQVSEETKPFILTR